MTDRHLMQGDPNPDLRRALWWSAVFDAKTAAEETYPSAGFKSSIDAALKALDQARPLLAYEESRYLRESVEALLAGVECVERALKRAAMCVDDKDHPNEIPGDLIEPTVALLRRVEAEAKAIANRANALKVRVEPVS